MKTSNLILYYFEYDNDDHNDIEDSDTLSNILNAYDFHKNNLL